MEYEYSVIYTVDVPGYIEPGIFSPPHPEKWEQTEGNKDALEVFFGKGGHHRKWVGVLNQQEFDEFIESTGMHAEDVETEGAIGVPGFPPNQIEPAISFVLDDDEVIVGAYVTPNPISGSEFSWPEVRAEILRKYGDGA